MLVELWPLSKLEYLVNKSGLKNEMYVDKCVLMSSSVTCYVRRVIVGYVNITTKVIKFEMKDPGTLKVRLVEIE